MPASNFLQQKVIFLSAALAGMGGLWVLLALYGGVSVLIALIDSAVYMALLSAAGYFYWYIAGNLVLLLHRVTIAVVVQILCTGVVFAAMVITGAQRPEQFSHTIPLHLIYGLLLWIVLSASYRIIGHKEVQATESSEAAKAIEAVKAAAAKHAGPAETMQQAEATGTIPKTTEAATSETGRITSPTETSPLPKTEIIERISVRKGAQIEIIPVDHIAYIQAYGDYVMLHSESGRHIKEQTMKFYETSLPDTFVRIHRSFIVNTDRIVSVELAGKENYTIKLKNGIAIRASAAGYKLLKQRLSL